MLISQILLDQFTQGLLHLNGNLVGHISAQQFLVLDNIITKLDATNPLRIWSSSI
jgi:hypothetical protein